MITIALVHFFIYPYAVKAHCDRLLIIEISILDGNLHYYRRLIKEELRWAWTLKDLVYLLHDVTACICNCDGGITVDVDICMEMGVGNTHDKKKWFYVVVFSTIFNNFVFRV